MADNIINRKGTKAFVKRMAEKHRPGWEFTQVSAHALDVIEMKAKAFIIQQVKQLPSTGKTIDFPDL